MSDLVDGLSNVEALTAQIAALQKGQPTGSTANSAADPGTFILQTQQNFNQMLTSLMAAPDDGSGDNSSSDSTDAFSSFIGGSDQASLQAQLQTATSTSAANLQKLSALEQNSQLIGKQVIYQNSAGAQNQAVVSQIMVDQKGNASIVTGNGLQIPVTAIIGLKQ
jgi:hypothetical protein